MPPIIAGVAAAITATAGAVGVTVAAGVVTSLATSLVVSGIMMGVNAGLSAIFHHPSVKSDAATSQLSMRQPISYRRVIYGTVRVGGVITFMQLAGSNNEYLHMVLTPAGHEVNSIGNTVYLDDTAVTIAINGGGTSDGGYHPTGGTYLKHILIEKHLGDPSDTSQPFPLLAAECPTQWTSSHLQRGCAKVHIQLKWDEATFKNGLPQSIAFDIEGKKCYDTRTASTVFTNNPAVCLRDFLLDTQYGMAATSAFLDDDSIEAAANICDEDVNLKAGGTQKRYTCDGAFDASVNRGDVLKAMLPAMAGIVVPPGDKWRMYPGAYRDSVLSLTDADLRGPITYTARVSRRDLANGVKGTFISPDNQWQPSDFPPYQSSDYLSEDGEALWTDISLDFTTNSIRAQRLAKVILEQGRHNLPLTLPCRLTAFPVQPGDTIDFTHARLGWDAKTFMVTHTALVQDGDKDAPSLGVDLSLIPVESSIYDWDEDVDEGELKERSPTMLRLITTRFLTTVYASSKAAPSRQQTRLLRVLRGRPLSEMRITEVRLTYGARRGLTQTSMTLGSVLR